MNKEEEIKYKIKVHENAIKLSTDILISLRAKLTEAEKPKLRHGDFGLCVNGKDWFVVDGSENDRIYTHLLWDLDFNRRNQWRHDNVILAEATIFGNIFDLLKGWNKDLDRTNIDGFVLAICGDRIVVGGRRFLIKQAEEIWHKLGRIIATLKRNSPQE